MFFPRCGAIHTFFMSTAIDVVMTDRSERVVYIKEAMAPFKLAWCARAGNTYEMAAFSAGKAGIKKGMFLSRKGGV